MKPPPHSKDLRKGRFSQPNARYFITFKTVPPSTALTTPLYLDSFSKALNEMEAEAQLSEASYTLMPDHIHALFRIGSVLTLSQVVAKLKQLSRKSSKPTPLHWQPSYHDHKLRADAELHPILHYIYLNPYRAKLLPADQSWPYTHINPQDWTWLQPLLNQNCPYPEWLAQ